MIAWQIIHNDSHDLKKDGVIVIPQSFEGNALSITLDTREYENNREILGWLYQYSGEVIKRYPIFTGDEVLSLIIPVTDSLEFFPTTYLSLQYGLKIAYANIANGATGAGASTSIPSIILGLPDRVAALESIPPVSLSSVNTAITALQQSDTSQNTAIGTIQTNVSNLSTEVSNLRDTPASSSSSSYTLVAANQALESGKKYLATSSGLICTLPSNPAIGAVISLSTGNFNLRVNHGNSDQRILNLSTLTLLGINSGIILKPYSDIDVMFLGGNLWKSVYRTRVVNNWTADFLAATASQITYTPVANFAYTYYDDQILSRINDGVLSGAGTIAYASSLVFTVTAINPFFLDSFRVYRGQFNGAGNMPNTAKVYRGNSANEANLLTQANLINTSGNTVFPVSTPIASREYCFSFYDVPSSYVSILELMIFGREYIGGEMLAS